MPIEFWYGEEHSQNTQENFDRDALIQQFRVKFERSRHTVFCVFNFSAGRQIDLAIFTNHSIIAVELKKYDGPIVGFENGPWMLKDSSVKIDAGTSDNPFQQLRDSRHGLRDLLNRRKKRFLSPQKAVGVHFQNIAGVLVFPKLYTESDIDYDKPRSPWFHICAFSDLALYIDRIKTHKFEFAEQEIRAFLSGVRCTPILDESSPRQQSDIPFRPVLKNKPPETITPPKVEPLSRQTPSSSELPRTLDPVQASTPASSASPELQRGTPPASARPPYTPQPLQRGPVPPKPLPVPPRPMSKSVAAEPITPPKAERAAEKTSSLGLPPQSSEFPDPAPSPSPKKPEPQRDTRSLFIKMLEERLALRSEATVKAEAGVPPKTEGATVPPRPVSKNAASELLTPPKTEPTSKQAPSPSAPTQTSNRVQPSSRPAPASLFGERLKEVLYQQSSAETPKSVPVSPPPLPTSPPMRQAEAENSRPAKPAIPARPLPAHPLVNPPPVSKNSAPESNPSEKTTASAHQAVDRIPPTTETGPAAKSISATQNIQKADPAKTANPSAPTQKAAAENRIECGAAKPNSGTISDWISMRSAKCNELYGEAVRIVQNEEYISAYGLRQLLELAVKPAYLPINVDDVEWNILYRMEFNKLVEKHGYKYYPLIRSGTWLQRAKRWIQQIKDDLYVPLAVIFWGHSEKELAEREYQYKKGESNPQLYEEAIWLVRAYPLGGVELLTHRLNIRKKRARQLLRRMCKEGIFKRDFVTMNKELADKYLYLDAVRAVRESGDGTLSLLQEQLNICRGAAKGLQDELRARGVLD